METSNVYYDTYDKDPILVQTPDGWHKYWVRFVRSTINPDDGIWVVRYYNGGSFIREEII